MKEEKKIKKRYVVLGVFVALIGLVAVLNQLGVFRHLLVSSAQSRSQIQKTLQAQIDTGRDQIFRDNIVEYSDIPYLSDQSYDHLLDVLHPANPDSLLPTIINVHGGGLVGGVKEINTPQSRYFASQGFCVINVNYTRLPTGTYKNIIQDIFEVLHWIEMNFEQYSIDLEHVFMTGDSGGGHIVSVTAAVLNSDPLRTYYEVSQPAFQVRRFALSCPMVGTETLVKPETVADWIFHYAIGPDIYKDSEAMKQASVYQIMEQCEYPEVFILTTEGDTAFYTRAIEFDSFLTELGISHQLKAYEGNEHQLTHVFNVSYPEWEESIGANQDIVEFFRAAG